MSVWAIIWAATYKGRLGGRASTLTQHIGLSPVTLPSTLFSKRDRHRWGCCSTLSADTKPCRLLATPAEGLGAMASSGRQESLQ